MKQTSHSCPENGRAVNLWQVTEMELSYHNKQLPKDRPIINSSKAAYEVLGNLWDINKIELLEHFKILLLNRHYRCLGISNIATGGTAACVVDPRIIFATALKANATNIILAHNHPSGNLTPSEEDKKMTDQLIEGGKYLQINIRDHLILSSTEYLSMADEGYVFN